METISTTIDDQLLSYLEGTLEASEVRILEDQIQKSEVLKGRLEELRTIHIFLQRSNTLEIPSKTFTQRVLSNLDSYKVTQTISPKNGLILLGGIIVAAGILISLISAGSFDSISAPVSLNSLPIKKEWIKNPLPTFSLDVKQLMKVILILATGLSFVLLDRTILRPLFARRSHL